MKKALKRSLSLLLAIAIIFSSMYVGLSKLDFSGLFTVKASAANVVSSGTCGNGLKWTLDDEGTLTISGNGKLGGYLLPSQVPWYSYRNQIVCLIIEEGVTAIGSSSGHTFYNHSAIKSILLPVSLKSIGSYAFTGCNSATIYYAGTSEEWGSISIDTSTWSNQILNDPTRLHFNTNQESLIYYEDGGKTYFIKDFYDDRIIKNKNICINGEEYNTEKGSVAIKDNQLLTENTLEYTDTFSDFHKSIFNKKYLDDPVEFLFLYRKKSNTKPYINYIYYRNETIGGNWKNGLSEKVTIPYGVEDFYKIEVCATAQKGNIARVCLTQTGEDTLESTDGIFDVSQLGKVFEPNKDILVYCIDDLGNASDVLKTQIKVEKEKSVVEIVKDGKIELFSTSGTSFIISDDVPIIGGTQIGISFARLPISVEKEDSKYKVAIGVTNDMTKNQWKSLKDGLKEVKKMKTEREKYKKMEELREAFEADKVKGETIGSGSIDMDILGFVEWEVIDGSPVITDSYVGISAINASYSWKTPYVVYGVPCYTEVGVGVSISTDGQALGVTNDEIIPIEWDIKLSIKPKLTLGAGVGCPSFLSLGIEGKGEIEWYQDFAEKYREINLTLSASIKAKVMLVTLRKEHPPKHWILWSGLYGTDSQNALSDSAEQYYSSYAVDLFNAYNYNTLADRDYANQTEWIGGYTPALFSSRDISINGYENSFLQTNIYSDSRQQLIEFNGGKMLVWVMDDITRESANRTELVYSLYDESTATWSEPVAICDDGTADFLPDIVSDGNNVWVTWQNMNTTFTEDTATLENYSAAAEIYVAKYNGETGEFETATQLTDDVLVDSMPVVTAENGNVSVVWVCNSANDYFGIKGINSIKTVTISNGVLGDIKTVKTDLTSVSSIDCKLSKDELYIAYAYDLDNDYNDMSDMEIFQLKVSDDNITETRLTENTVLDSAPCYSNLGGGSSLVWYSEGNFNVFTLDSNEVSTVFTENVGATDIYSVSQSAGDISYIIWSQTEGEQVIFYGAVFDGSKWSEPVLLGEATGKAINPSAIVDADGTMFVAYNSVIRGEVTETVEETGEEFTYYTDVQTDLALLKVYQNSNISLSDDNLKIDVESVSPGNIIPFTFNVKNNGTTFVDSIDVCIDDEFNSSVQVDLLPGQETSVTINYTVPEIVAETNLSITAQPSGSLDYDSTDNEVSISYGYTELDVDDVAVYSTALRNTITARICNISAIDSGAFTVKIRENDATGAIVSVETYDNLSTGETLLIRQEFDKVSLSYDEDGVSKYYIEVVANNTEYLTGNNSGFAVLTEENNTGVSSEMLLEYVNDGFVHAYGVIQNNEFAEHEVYAKIEILDEAGNVIGLKFKKVSLTDKETYTLDENVYISGEYYETRLTLLDIGTEDISLRIPKGVTTIDELDFENCLDVVKLIIPDSVTSIGTDALSGCDNLTVYCFPDSVAQTYCEENSIPYVLYQMSPVDETTIDSTQKYIFTEKLGCSSLESIVNITGYEFIVSPISDMLLFGTGLTIEVFDEKENIDNYTLVVNGDTNGDSVCDVLDAWQVSLASNGHRTLDGAYALAADSNSDDIVDVTDYQSIINKVVS